MGCQVLDGYRTRHQQDESGGSTRANFHLLTSGNNLRFKSKITGLIIDPNKDDPWQRTTRIIVEDPFPYLQATILLHKTSDEEDDSEINSKRSSNRAGDSATHVDSQSG